MRVTVKNPETEYMVVDNAKWVEVDKDGIRIEFHLMDDGDVHCRTECFYDSPLSYKDAYFESLYDLIWCAILGQKHKIEEEIKNEERHKQDNQGRL